MPELDHVCLLVFGRLHGVTRRRLADLVRRNGGRLATRPGAHITLVAVGHGTAGRAQAGAPPRAMIEGIGADAAVVSELTLKRRLGLASPPEPETRSLTEADLARLSGLDDGIVAWLGLYDVVEPVDGRYGYRDLVGARETARLLKQGIGLGEILRAAVSLRRQTGLRLSEARLAEAPSGEILQDFAGRLLGFDGQYRLPLGEAAQSVDEMVERAEQCEAMAAYAEAERWYRAALRMDPTDPVIPFNLGNILKAQHRPAEAAVAWRMALHREPGFAEAWFNLAIAAEDAARPDDAARFYGQALEAQPDYADAAFNLGLLLYRRRRFAEAVPIWERVLVLEPRSRQAQAARRYAALCRLETPG